MYALKDSEETELLRDLHMQKPAIGRCAFCPDWVIEGTAEEVTSATKNHREVVHQITVKKLARGTGRPCASDECRNLGSIRRGRFAGWCSRCRDRVLGEEKAQAQRERSERKALEAAERVTKKAVVPRPSVPKRKHRKRDPDDPFVRERHPMHLMTEERAEKVLQLYAEGHSAVSIGRAYWEEWGYKGDKSLTQMVYALLRKRGVSRRSRGESARLTLARDGRPKSDYVQPSLVTPERLELVERLVSEGCTVRAIACIAWSVWGFASVESCRESIARHGRRRGTDLGPRIMREIPAISRSDAKKLIESL